MLLVAQHEDSEMSEKFSGVNAMRELVAAVAGERGWGETRESWLSKAARRAGISFRAAKAIFYGEITDENHRAARLLRDAAEQKAKDEAATLATRFETIAGAMNASDPDFYSADVAALVYAARTLRGLDRAGSDGE
jgi:hypothetical protein